jgi:gas vesicle protein
MDTLWNRVKKNLVEWYDTAYDKTDELARIGKKKIEVAGLNRAIEKHLSELGGRLYDLVVEQGHRGNRTADDEQVQRIVSEVRELERQLKMKEEEIASIREEKHHEAQEGEEEERK